METKELETKLTGIEQKLSQFVEKHAAEVATVGAASTETKSALEKLGNQWNETANRLLAIEQKMVAPTGGMSENKSVGQSFIDSEQYKSFLSNGTKHSGAVKVGSFHKSTLINATTSLSENVLVPPDRRSGILTPGLQRLTVRDLLPALPTNSNSIEFTKESSFTNSAAIQAAEGDAKAESALAFSLSQVGVKTLAHFLPASRQILEDAPGLAAYINSRLLYGLKFKEEQELLNGSGAGSEISGLITNSTTYDTTRTTVATDTFVDVISHALQQVRDSFLEPDAVVMHPQDWESIRLLKTTTNEYVFADPYGVQGNQIWGVRVVPTPAMARSQFLVGSFALGASIWDKADATVEVSREHSDYFTRNLVAILCEERLALTVYRALAFVYGGFPFGS